VAIKELENMLNIQLVDRTNKNVTVTSLGRDVARQARVVLRELEDLVDMAKGNQLPLTGPLKLGVIPTIAPFLLPRLLPALRDEFPDLKLYLKEDLTERVYERLMDGELDLILIALPYDLRNTSDMVLFEDPFYLAYQQNSALLGPGAYNLDELPSDSILLLEDGHCLRDHALSACNIKNVDKVSNITATSLLTLVQMVDADLGIYDGRRRVEIGGIHERARVGHRDLGEGGGVELVERVVRHLQEGLLSDGVRVILDAVEHHDRVVERVPQDREQCRDRAGGDLGTYECVDTQRDQEVV
jgi:DNA-binding transcriptional LysR family regulator